MRRMMLAGFAIAAALNGVAAAEPGPNGANNYGLCKAYFSGSETGRANKRSAPPFAALERVAEEAYDGEFGENDASMDDKVGWWCGQNAPHPSSNGGANGSAGGGKSNGKGNAKNSR